ncbi:propanediol dehydratase small subunit [Streptomyces sp. V4I23]|uniref:hypothetical protein n=1 Tax=Streptomyces sp. V4I23 TaxID=3042282 RepID=UPI00278058EB|nr:hypothetical protein [Streptomyces sp. V4I23]MDQ1010167.1 propanediol dehydratase small subunit [Streptomyces sp. V4I23]
MAERTVKAVTHGRVTSRDFELCLRLTEATLRIEISEANESGRTPAAGLGMRRAVVICAVGLLRAYGSLGIKDNHSVMSS